MPRPFIQLFQTPRHQYVYDANKNEFLPVSKEAFSFLLECVNGTADITSSTLDEIQALREQGYLKTESVVQDIFHPYTPYLEDFLNRKIVQITLQLTQGCNLRCKYCVYSEEANTHQRSHSAKHMDWDMAKKTIDFLYNRSVDSREVAIGFYGGEPLLGFPLIKQSIRYAKQLFDGKKLLFTITTNGTLLTDEIIQFLDQEDVQVMISLDGPKEIHDKNRVFAGTGEGSFDTIMKNLDRVKELAPKLYDRLQFSMVMDPSNDFDCINEITVSTKDFNRHNLNAVIVETEYDDNNEVAFSEEYTWKARYQEFLALLSGFNRFPREKVSAISYGAFTSLLSDSKYMDVFGPLRQIDVPSGPCIPGQMRLFVNADGLLFPCERVSEKSKAMCIGSLDTGIDIEKATKFLNVGAITKEACRNCWCIRHCSICAKKADDGTETLSPKVKLLHCENVRANAYEKLRQLILLNELGVYYRDQLRMKEEFWNAD